MDRLALGEFVDFRRVVRARARKLGEFFVMSHLVHRLLLVRRRRRRRIRLRRRLLLLLRQETVPVMLSRLVVRRLLGRVSRLGVITPRGSRIHRTRNWLCVGVDASIGVLHRRWAVAGLGRDPGHRAGLTGRSVASGLGRLLPPSPEEKENSDADEGQTSHHSDDDTDDGAGRDTATGRGFGRIGGRSCGAATPAATAATAAAGPGADYVCIGWVYREETEIVAFPPNLKSGDC